MADMFLSGLTGYVTIAGQNLAFGKWSFPMKIKLIPRNNFQNAGYNNWVIGFSGGSGTLNMPVYNAGTFLAQIAPGLVLGQSYVFVFGFTNAIFLTATCFVESIDAKNDAEGAPSIDVSLQSSGVFTAVIV